MESSFTNYVLIVKGLLAPGWCDDVKTLNTSYRRNSRALSHVSGLDLYKIIYLSNFQIIKILLKFIGLTGIYSYLKVSNIRRTLVGNKIVDHSDVVGASPVGAAPTTSSFSKLNTWLQWIGQRQQQGETRNIYVLGLGASYIRELTVSSALTSCEIDLWWIP